MEVLIDIHYAQASADLCVVREALAEEILVDSHEAAE